MMMMMMMIMMMMMMMMHYQPHPRLSTDQYSSSPPTSVVACVCWGGDGGIAWSWDHERPPRASSEDGRLYRIWYLVSGIWNLASGIIRHPQHTRPLVYRLRRSSSVVWFHLAVISMMVNRCISIAHGGLTVWLLPAALLLMHTFLIF